MGRDESSIKELKFHQLGINALVKFDIISSILMGISAIVFLVFTPFLGTLVRDIASAVGYGSAKLFYFIIVNFEFYSNLAVLYFFIDAFLFLIAGFGFYKQKNWGKTTHIIVWCLVLIIFPIGTLYGIFALWLNSKLK